MSRTVADMASIRAVDRSRLSPLAVAALAMGLLASGAATGAGFFRAADCGPRGAAIVGSAAARSVVDAGGGGAVWT